MGDAAAMQTARFDARYDELFAELRRLCRALGAGDDAEDVAQEVLVYGRSRLHELRDDEKLVPWLRRIAIRSATRARRARGRDLEAIDPVRDLGLGPIELGLDERAALRALPARQRQLVTLVYFAGYRQEEVAEMLGISRGTVAKTLWEARCALAHALVGYSRGAPS